MGKSVLGIDEAGRGPLIASMFIVGAMFVEEDLPMLKSLGVKDSKLLLHEKRIFLDKEIRKIAKKIKVIEVSAAEIDKAVDSKEGMNLNWLEAVKQAEIINELKPDRVVIDCPSTNIKKYREYLLNLVDDKLKKTMEVIVEHKADQNYVECSSASVVAKCAREESLNVLRKTVKEEFGSGYPSDPVTKEFVKKHWKKYPKIFRHSWSTYQKVANPEQQAGLDKF
ncbi:MAG: ribonuclease HII [Nanoarchaeota archaeon]|nr:ribonuclease HII [Nanoarchaeota archaeon]